MEGIPDWYWQSVNGNTSQLQPQYNNQVPLGAATAVPYVVPSPAGPVGYMPMMPYGYSHHMPMTPQVPLPVAPIMSTPRAGPVPAYVYTSEYYKQPPVQTNTVPVVTEIRSSSASPAPLNIHSSVAPQSVPLSLPPSYSGSMLPSLPTSKAGPAPTEIPQPSNEGPRTTTPTTDSSSGLGTQRAMPDTMKPTTAQIPVVRKGMVFVEDEVCMEECRARLARYAKFLPPKSVTLDPKPETHHYP